MANILNNLIPGLSKTIGIQMSSTYNLIADSQATKTIVPASKGEEINQVGEPSRSFFSIQYYDANGDPKYFNFSLLPAINPGLQGISGMAVPGAGPGIKIKSKMKHRSITIPGSTPVIQTIGVENTIIELVGIFTGFEKSFSQTKTYLNDSPGYLASSGDVSTVFRYEVLQPGTPVQLSIKASSGYVQDNTGAFVSDSNEKSITIESKILITDFEELIRQYDRSYFYIRAFVLTYPNTKRKDPKDPNAPKPVAFKPTVDPNAPKTINNVKPTPTPQTAVPPAGNTNIGLPTIRPNSNTNSYPSNSNTNSNSYPNNSNTGLPFIRPNSGNTTSPNPGLPIIRPNPTIQNSPTNSNIGLPTIRPNPSKPTTPPVRKNP